MAPSRTSNPPQRVVRLNFEETLKRCIGHFWCGVKDAFAWPSSFVIIYLSYTIRDRALKCFMLNGVIFLGSIFFFNHVTLPILHFFVGKSVLALTYAAQDESDADIDSSFVANLIDSLIKLAYQLFWVYPIFLLSSLLNAIWYQQIADKAYRFRYGKPSNQQLTYSRLPKMIADEIYRALLFLNYMVLATVVYIIPFIGPLLSFMHFCWIYAFYSFEYKWTAKGWNLEQRISYFEERWAYFAGFGFLFTVVTFFVNQFLSAGIFAMVFPVYIIMANNARPMPRNNEQEIFSTLVPYRFPVFWLAKKLNNRLIECIRGRANVQIPSAERRRGDDR